MAEEQSESLTLPEQQIEHVTNALNEFNKKNYTQCLQHMNKLENINQDFKMIHNKIVVEYYKSDLRKTNQFRKAMANLFGKFSIRTEAIEDMEHCTALYNHAILLFHQKKYDSALKITHKLFNFMESMDDDLAYKVCLLLVELHLLTHQYERAMCLITFIEGQMQTSNTSLLSTGDKEIKILKRDTKDGKKSNPSVDLFHEKLAYLRARCNLKLHNMKVVYGLLKEIVATKSQHASTILLRANFEYLKGNHKGAGKLLQAMCKMPFDVKTHGESSSIIFNNNTGLLFHSQGKYNLALHHFRLAYDENEKYNTNIARFLEVDNSSSQPLFTLGNSKKHEIVYNTGVNYLHMGKPTLAFECLIMAVQRYHKNPRLWLRLAECCIQAHKPSNRVDFDIPMMKICQTIGSGRHKKYILNSHLSNDKKYSVDSQSFAVPMPTLEFATLCLNNALNLMPNTPKTSNVTSTNGNNGVTPKDKDSGVLFSGKNSSSGNTPILSPSAHARPDDIIALTSAILCASAYVSLSLGDYYLAFEYATKLLDQANLSGQHKYLGNLYAGEALILLNKIPQALEYLNLDNLKDITIVADVSKTNKQDKMKDVDDSIDTISKRPIRWFPHTNNTAFLILKYNLAVAYCIQSQFDKAATLLKEIWQSRSPTTLVPAHVMMLVLYVQIQLGNHELTLQLIKQHCQ